MKRRVVVTGMGVVAPNANGVNDFELALRKGSSGLRRNQAMEEAGFGCRVAGVPQGTDALAESLFDESDLMAMNSAHRYASLAALEAWQDAGFERPAAADDRVDWDTGAILGTGIGGTRQGYRAQISLLQACRRTQQQRSKNHRRTHCRTRQ